MKRRTFLGSLTSASLVTHLGLGAAAADELSEASRRTNSSISRGTFALDDNRARFFSTAFSEPFRVLMLADTHLFTDDARGEPFRQYSGRMARAYNQTSHFRTGAATNPEESFANSLDLARGMQADLVALVGDIFSFPSEAAVEWVRKQLDEAGLAYLYVAGNHDWHYEGLPGTLEELRGEWIEKRLVSLYQGADPLMAAREIKGVRFVAIDNSYYEILPEQLEFFRAQVATDKPLVLFVHIPLYAPGRPVGFGCGHPDWNDKADRNYKLERRPRWPESGHTPVTMAFHREVFNAPNLLGVLAGHIHRPSLDVIQGVPQLVADANATGAYLELEFVPHG